MQNKLACLHRILLHWVSLLPYTQTLELPEKIAGTNTQAYFVMTKKKKFYNIDTSRWEEWNWLPNVIKLFTVVIYTYKLVRFTPPKEY
jgi:hypothetical protein